MIAVTRNDIWISDQSFSLNGDLADVKSLKALVLAKNLISLRFLLYFNRSQYHAFFVEASLKEAFMKESTDTDGGDNENINVQECKYFRL